MKQQTFTQCADRYIQRLRREGRHATAHVYTYALRSFRAFCGMPFADLAHLEKSHLRQGLLVYTRRKTGTPITVELLPPARDELRCCHTPAVPSGSPYLLPILSGTRPATCYSAYRELEVGTNFAQLVLSLKSRYKG